MNVKLREYDIPDVLFPGPTKQYFRQPQELVVNKYGQRFTTEEIIHAMEDGASVIASQPESIVYSRLTNITPSATAEEIRFYKDPQYFIPLHGSRYYAIKVYGASVKRKNLFTRTINAGCLISKACRYRALRHGRRHMHSQRQNPHTYQRG